MATIAIQVSSSVPAQQAAEKGLSAALAPSCGAATYAPSTPRAPAGTHRRWVTPPCIWTFLNSLGTSGLFGNLLSVLGRHFAPQAYAPAL